MVPDHVLTSSFNFPWGVPNDVSCCYCPRSSSFGLRVSWREKSAPVQRERMVIRKVFSRRGRACPRCVPMTWVPTSTKFAHLPSRQWPSPMQELPHCHLGMTLTVCPINMTEVANSWKIKPSLTLHSLRRARNFIRYI